MARVLFAQQNTIKTAIHNSRINFYFVTGFYSLVRYLHGGQRTPSELGILSSCLGKRQSRAVIFELCAKAHCELLILN